MKLKSFAKLITSESKVVVEDESGDLHEEYIGDDILNCKHLSREIIDICSGYYQIGVMIR